LIFSRPLDALTASIHDDEGARSSGGIALPAPRSRSSERELNFMSRVTGTSLMEMQSLKSRNAATVISLAGRPWIPRIPT
jgi:hypothetical protein